MNDATQRPRPDEHSPYYARYIDRVPSGSIVDVLRTQLADTIAPLQELDDAAALFAYAPGKWTVKEVVCHLIDTERVMMHRALRFARGDQTPLPGFDENTYVPAAEANARPLTDLLAELATVRAATIALLSGIPARAWTRTGTANGALCSVRALAWIIAGHELHHRALLQERYGITGITVPSA